MNMNRWAWGRNDCHRGCKQPLHVFQLTGIDRSNRIREDRGLHTRIKCNISKQGRKKNKDERKIVKQTRQLDVLRKCKDYMITNTKFRIYKTPPRVSKCYTNQNFIFVNKYRSCFYLNQLMYKCIYIYIYIYIYISQHYLFI